MAGRESRQDRLEDESDTEWGHWVVGSATLSWPRVGVEGTGGNGRGQRVRSDGQLRERGRVHCRWRKDRSQAPEVSDLACLPPHSCDNALRKSG